MSAEGGDGVHCEHEHDDGAYVLGALSPAERAAYERHLATCSFCREAVADIAALPDLLSRLDATEFAKLLDPTLTAAPQPRRRGAPVHHTRRHKSMGVRVLSTVSAFVLVAIMALVIVAWTRDTTSGGRPSGPAVAMSRVDPSSLVAATVRLTGTSGGTRVELDCTYSSSAPGKSTFRMVVFGTDGEQEDIGSWGANPGAETQIPGLTHFALGDIARVALVGSGGKVQLAYDVP
jgi:anti-sigma-K factor RskA